MNKQMLIDAVHPEETRVALVNDTRVEDFDFETTGNEQLRGNIYLAKVTRVEPSLQACFIEYGGNRHGFLAFSEIHPDYYQLPQEDRDALIEEAAREAAEADEDDLDDGEDDDLDHDDDDEVDQADTAEASGDDADDSGDSGTNDGEATGATDAPEATEDDDKKPSAKAARRQRTPRKSRTSSAHRRYKIQEVIRRRQVLLVQVVKEERGNKGAALTTYLSLAGRYSVLMPNTPRGGGISRKIPSGNDRKRLKTVMQGLEVPKGMGLIVRTAGAKRTKAEISRDYDYLQKLWAKIRAKTLDSMAPAQIHEEGGLVHRAMRDMFDSKIKEVIVHGDAAYREAKDLAKTLMPTQALKVKRWTASAPLFVSEGVEAQLDSVFNPTVQMKSGGYLVINQTEALVAIDVNSGKSTKERSIEQTALRTNLEAAEEACRQMRLRDLAGLVVIDFIDMDENKNNRAVEKKMKECLSLDRARVQNSRISQFGLMEISRQRRRAGVLQATSAKCDACDGTGRRRSVPSSALQLLRAIEARAAGGGLSGMTVTAPTEVALYLLNSKRDAIAAIEDDAGFTIAIKSAASMIPGDFEMVADKSSRGRGRKKFNRADFMEGDKDDHLLPEADEEEDTEIEVSEPRPERGEEDSEDGGPRKRRRRGRRGGRKRKRDGDVVDPGAPPSDGGALLDGLAVSVTSLLADEQPDLPVAEDGGLTAAPVATPQAKVKAGPASENNDPTAETGDSEDGAGPKKRRRRRRRRNKSDGEEATTPAEETATTTKIDAVSEEAAPVEVEPVAAEQTEAEEAPAEKPKRRRRGKTVAAEAEPAKPEETPVTAPAETTKPAAPITTEPVLETSTKTKKKKRGWWSR